MKDLLEIITETFLLVFACATISAALAFIIIPAIKEIFRWNL